MDSVIRKFPIGIQNFESLINDGYVYVDKTALVYRMATTGRYYFLSRPRRFGKSLLISSRLTTTTVQRRIVLKNSSAVPGLANILRKSIINIW
jgi:hypothetical protein